MEIFRGIRNLDRTLTHPVVTIGNFDGVHQGHQRIIATAIEKARARKGMAVAYTFRPHPQVALRPERNVQLLSTYDEKLEFLAQTGLDAVVEEPFSREFSTIAPQEFFNEVLLRRLSAEAIVVGYDFAFGRERAGHLEALGKFCQGAGVELTVVPPQRVLAGGEGTGEGEVVSSSRIRQHLLAGEMEAAARLMGRPFFYRGVVVKGEGRGRKLGFPTANLKLENKLALPYGVYATWAVRDGKRHPSVTNVGVRPTFQTDRELPALVETHLLDQTIDLYGTTLEVQFVRKLREERRFSGIDELKAQIGRDAQQARELLR